MGLTPISFFHGYGFRTEAKMWFKLNHDLWFNFTLMLFRASANAAALSPTTSRDIGHASNAREGLRQFMEMDGKADGRTDGLTGGRSTNGWMDFFVRPSI